MMSTAFRFTISLLASILVGASSAHADPVGSYKIGVCFALTGEAAKWTAAQRQGIELAARDQRKRGALLEIVWDDTGVSTEKSVSCFKRMVQVEHAEIIIGNVWAFLTLPMIPLTERLHIPLISPGFYREQCPSRSQYFFSVSEQIGDVMPAFDRLLARHPAWRRIAILAFDDHTWGLANEQAVTAAARAHQREVVDVVRTQEMHPDLRSIYPAMLRKKPDAIFAFHEPLGLVRPLRELQYKGAIVVGNAIGEQIWDEGKAAGVFEGVYFADVPASDEFSAQYQALSGRLPILEAHSGYDALSLAVQALQKNRLDPAAALRTEEFEGVYQKLKFGNSCAAKHSDWRIFRILNGRPTVDE